MFFNYGDEESEPMKTCKENANNDLYKIAQEMLNILKEMQKPTIVSLPGSSPNIKQTNETLKKARQRYYINDKHEILAVSDPLFHCIGKAGYSVYDGFNSIEIFDGEIIISKEDFDNAVAKLGKENAFHLSQWPALIKEELFK